MTLYSIPYSVDKAVDCKTDLKKGPWKPTSNKNNGGGNNQGRFQGKCNYCRKYGYKEVDCWAKYGKPKAKEERTIKQLKR